MASAAPVQLVSPEKETELFFEALGDCIGDAGPEFLQLGLLQPAKTNPPTIAAGATGSAVKKLQKSLTAAGFDTPVTGEFDDLTEIRLIGFQSKHDLPMTAVADQKTWDVLLEETKGGKFTQTVTDIFSILTPIASSTASHFSSGKAPAAASVAAPAPTSVPLTQQPWFWPVTIVGGIVVVGGIAYMVTK